MAMLIAERSLRDRRRGFVGWALGIAAYVALVASVYPSVQSSGIQGAIRNYPKGLKAFFGGSGAFDFSTGAGYLHVELFSLVLPALLAIVGIGFGAAALAGEQEAGQMDLLLAYPVTRGRVVVEKIGALTSMLLGLAVVVTVSIAIIGALGNLNVATSRVAIASLGAAFAALFFGLTAMLAGAATGKRTTAIAVGTALFAASYLLAGLAELVSWIEPLRVLSPLYHATGTQPIRNGLPVGNYAVLVALCAVTAVAVVVVFDRHDLTR